MTGPEHYAESERLLSQAELDAHDPMRKYAEDANVIAAAQVHATLALAAAHAEPIAQSLGTESDEIAAAWSEAIS